jgi:hypothetical protein
MKKLRYVQYVLLLVLSFFLAGCPPFPVTILSPSNGALFELGEAIVFRGSATDLIDGNLSGTSLVWTSNRDGQIGTGTEFPRNDLSEDTHTITLTAINSLGETGTATVTITIGEESSSTTTTNPTLTTTTTSINNISGELEIDKIIGPVMVSMEAELMIPFHVEGTEIIAEGGPWMTPIEGNDVPDIASCLVDYTGEFGISNVGGELNTLNPNEPFLYFTFEVYETEYWTRTCPDGTSSDEWTPDPWESSCAMDLVDGYVWGGGPNSRFRYTIHLDATP